MAETGHPPTETSSDAPPKAAETERLVGVTMGLGLVAAFLAMAAVSWIADGMLEGKTAQFDRTVSRAVHSIASPRVTDVMRLASRFGGPSWLVLVAVLLLASFVARRWYRGAVLLVVALGGAGLIDTLLKISFRRQRPSPLFDQPLPGSYSFPSGHALFAFVFFGSAAVLLADRISSRPLRVVVFGVAASLIGLIGTSRIYLNVHHPSDVAAGYLVALSWIVAVAFGDHLASQGIFRRDDWYRLIKA